jgi:hypothetical protein
MGSISLGAGRKSPGYQQRCRLACTREAPGRQGLLPARDREVGQTEWLHGDRAVRVLLSRYLVPIRALGALGAEIMNRIFYRRSLMMGIVGKCCC